MNDGGVSAQVTRLGVLMSAAWAFAARILASVFGLAVVALLTRALNPDAVGTYFVVVSIATFASGVAGLGIGKSIMRFAGEAEVASPTERGRIVVKGLGLVTIGGMIGALAVLGIDKLGLFAGSEWSDYAVLLAVLVAVGALRFVTPEALRALGDVRSASLLTETLPQAALAGGLLCALAVGIDVHVKGVLAITTVAWLAVVVGSVVMLNQRLSPVDTQGTAPGMIAYLSVGFPWLGSVLAGFAIGQFALIALATFAGTAEAAQYGVAFRLSLWVTLPHAIVQATIQPYAVRLWAARDHVRLETLMRQSATIATFVAVLGFAFFGVFGRPILALLFGITYTSGYGVLMILAAAHVVAIATGASMLLLALTGRQFAVLALSAVVAPISAILIAVLAWGFGSNGAALGSALGTTALNIGAAVVALRTMRVRTWILPSLSSVTGLRTVLRSNRA